MNKMIEYHTLEKYFEYHPSLSKADESGMPPDKGVQQSYKDIAHTGANVMFRAKIKGHTHLDENIPLHMSVKTFDKPEQMPIKDVQAAAEELDIQRPNPHELQYEPIIFNSKKNGNTYYMLKITGTHPSIEQLNQKFKGQGITHDKFMAHITINKEIYDKVKSEGIKPHEVEFSPLMIEHGAGNTTHIFQDNESHKDHLSDITPKYQKLAASEEEYGESLQKGIKSTVAALAVTAGLSSPMPLDKPIDHQPKAGSHQIEPNEPGPQYNSQRMLSTIATVESSGGKNINHAPLGGMHEGEKAFGKYGLTPVIIRETIKLNRDLRDSHGKAAQLQGQDMVNYLQDNPELEEQVAQKHLSRLEHHFGQNPSEIGYAWLNGVTGTYKAKKENKNLDEHWHVKKIKSAYQQQVVPRLQAKN